ncbi:MAG: adenylate/guanylate cyclase domain-containing protein [Magnetococcales bacterium]|nr:adenylate/guanylate cyclase domain-containing protein [Magnetococcales bacterium]
MLAHVLGFFRISLLDRLEYVFYDMRVRFTQENRVDPRVVIVDIDEKSLGEIGRWPWNRDVVSRLTNTLFDRYRIAVLGFDVVFAEPDTSSGLDALENMANGSLKNNKAFNRELKRLKPSLDRDKIFAESLKNHPVITGFYFKYNPNEKAATSGTLPAPLIRTSELDPNLKAQFVKAFGFGGNLTAIQRSAYGGGFFDNALVGDDGIFRRVPLILRYKDGLYPSLALAVTKAGTGDLPLTFGLGWIGLGRERIPVDHQMAVTVPFLGKQGSFPYVSAVDVLTGRADPAVLQDNVVLVGSTAPGLMDLRSTPVQSAYPGVEVHANIISGILDGRIKHHPDYSLGIELITVLTLGILLSVLIPRLSPLASLVITISSLLIIVWMNLYFWKYNNFILPLVAPVVTIVGLMFLHMTYGFFVESRGKKQISNMFGHYIPSELVEEMSKSEKAFSIGGESREMTVLFSDVRGFTTISEGLDPESLTSLMNAFLTPMTQVIHHHRGTIDKYMGDAIMAFWGAPIEDENHARHALLAGLEMIDQLDVINDDFRTRGWPELKIGVGLNTGLMNVGNMGSEFRMAYTVLGDSVNLGARLESLTKQYGVMFLVSEYTRNEVDDVTFRYLDQVRVKGKDEPVMIYEPLGLTDQISPTVLEELKIYHQAVEQYADQGFAKAEKLFLALRKHDPDRMIYHIYLDRTRHFKANPPGPQWDGVFTHTTK